MECGQQRLKVKMLLLQHCALRKFHMIDGQNTCDQIMSDRKSKRILLTYMRSMCNNNLEIVGDKRSPQ